MNLQTFWVQVQQVLDKAKEKERKRKPLNPISYRKFLEAEISQQRGILNPLLHKGPTTAMAHDAACVLVGVSYRTPWTPNARLSSYGFSVSQVRRMFNRVSHDDLSTYKEEFFPGLLEVYFAIFGRQNTLVEHLLDYGAERVGSDGSCRWASVRLIAVQFIKQEDEGVRTSWLPDEGAKERLVIKVGARVWRTLLGWDVGKGDDLPVLDGFWETSWKCFDDSRKDRKKERGDWRAAAPLRMRQYAEELREARYKAEEVALERPIAKTLRDLYGDSGNTSPGESLGRLMAMLQGTICLVPWAVTDPKDPQPLPVLVMPAFTELSASAWVCIPRRLLQQQSDLTDWDPCARVKDSFSFICVRDQHVAPLGGDDSGHGVVYPLLQKEEFKKFEKRLKGIEKPVFAFLDAGLELTGDAHEGRETNYTLILGDPEVLKHVERIVSYEEGKEEAPMLNDEKLWQRFARQLKGHYALFQEDGIAGFVDRSSSELRIHKILKCRPPSQEELNRMMKNPDIVNDRYSLLRWLTWCVHEAGPKKHSTLDSDCIALSAGGDGVLRVFLEGKLALVIRKRTALGEAPARMGMEWGDKEGKAPIAKLREQIGEALGQEPEEASGGRHENLVNDIVATILRISDTPGEGALLVFSTKEKYLLGMVPDDFRMVWARDRSLSDTEREVLHSLAVMDGALLIETKQERQHTARARRFIAAQVPRKGAPWGGDKMRDWIDRNKGVRTCGGMHNDATEDLDWWAKNLGAKGTRHRAVFQLLLAVEPKTQEDEKNGPLVCSISADGPVSLYRYRYCKHCKRNYLWISRIVK